MRVLFVGNSYTLYGDVPAQVAALAAADESAPALRVDRVAEGGSTWKDHARSTGALDRIASGEFTDVALQDKSTQPLPDARDFFAYGAELARAATDAGAAVWLFSTWARRAGHAIYRWSWSGKGPAEMTRRVRDAYDRLARDVGGRVIPVGDVWERARLDHPALRLHDADDHHASPLGSHLTAVALYAWLTERDPTAVAYRPPDVPADAAATIRRVVADVAPFAR